ncbi:MAG: methyl-accepting chemotaxis protein, partial [Marinobacter sp.]
LATMVSGLRELVRSIESGATNIAASAEELSTVTSQTSDGINRQKQETDQVATAMNEMTATVADIARNAEQAFTIASDATSQATKGEHEVKETVNQVNSLSQEVSQSMEIIQGLQAETANIGTVLDVIKSVAEQTNLLALNAAIEAARAGDAGRGFAVVADEVRNLAQRTQTSTEEINSMIERLQKGASDAVDVMKASTAVSNVSMEKAQDAMDSLNRIADSITAISQMTSQIATASEEQTSVTEELNASITRIADQGQEAAAAASENDVYSGHIEQIGQVLDGNVSRFRV